MHREKPHPGRYVVLHHQGVEDQHYDFMLEVEEGAPLKTWRLPKWPLDEFHVEATELPDHRNAFLTYEGALSEGRGTVTRVAGGPCVIGGQHPLLQIRFNDGQTLHLTRCVDRGSDSKAWHAWQACTI